MAEGLSTLLLTCRWAEIDVGDDGKVRSRCVDLDDGSLSKWHVAFSASVWLR